MKNIKDSYEMHLLKGVAEITASGDETGIDVAQYLDDAMAILMLGEATPDGETLDVKILGSKDGGSTYPDTLAEFDQITNNDEQIASVGFNVGEYNYIKAEWVVSTLGGTPAWTFGVVVLLNTPVDKSGLNVGEIKND